MHFPNTLFLIADKKSQYPKYTIVLILLLYTLVFKIIELKKSYISLLLYIEEDSYVYILLHMLELYMAP